MKKFTKDILIIIIGLIILVFVWGGWQALQFKQNPTPDNSEVFCTADAKMCSGGTYVGRVAPDCDFAACPGN